MVKNLPAMWETRVEPLHREDPQEKGMATYSSILAWEIPWGHEESDTTEQFPFSSFLHLKTLKPLKMTMYICLWIWKMSVITFIEKSKFQNELI